MKWKCEVPKTVPQCVLGDLSLLHSGNYKQLSIVAKWGKAHPVRCAALNRGVHGHFISPHCQTKGLLTTWQRKRRKLVPKTALIKRGGNVVAVKMLLAFSKFKYMCLMDLDLHNSAMSTLAQRLHKANLVSKLWPGFDCTSTVNYTTLWHNMLRSPKIYMYSKTSRLHVTFKTYN